MGNCLVIQDRKEIKIMRVADGSKVLKVPTPSSLKHVQEAIAEPLPSHSISGVLPVKAPAAVADPGAVRVKLVISKQELKKMLEKEGMSLDDVVSLMRKEASDRESQQECCGGWRPALESIPEGSDL
ncbi:uncharacterized protein LOC133906280 [Phragmites australis]|uniref:uncharacterized protein LOC133906280 n=1 Tax=Phragmites australis TaxID=29695 RepID=UPI002D77633B|nr:uncharacterized protein LOC133906280 [Phragmites australis]